MTKPEETEVKKKNTQDNMRSNPTILLYGERNDNGVAFHSFSEKGLIHFKFLEGLIITRDK